MEVAVAQDLGGVSVQGVRSGSELIRRNALRQAVLRGETGTKHTEFADQFVRRVDDRLEALGFRLGGHHPVEDNLVLKVHAPLAPVAGAIPGLAGGQRKAIIPPATTTASLFPYFFTPPPFHSV